MSQPVRCHHCSSTFIGETSQSLVFVGMFKDSHDKDYIPGPRDTYRCKACGWINVFKPQAVRDYRNIDLKAS